VKTTALLKEKETSIKGVWRLQQDLNVCWANHKVSCWLYHIILWVTGKSMF